MSFQEECQPRNDASDDEDRCVCAKLILFALDQGRLMEEVRPQTGHVEKTSDRDYEVEERYAIRP
ncbi:hypothetical protein GP486_008420 [Trichoglossum hirsutum]|uniref:Uncharacterized protein n=1 Tax=Trichoglossum hirsutum TaxID=265104 RepID=A0A9P8IGS7_9PEZI|nr:hypothetical protein GP486_008420 [Trichoglossum hirsutum]